MGPAMMQVGNRKVRCTVIEFTENGARIKTPIGSVLTVDVNKLSRLPEEVESGTNQNDARLQRLSDSFVGQRSH